MNYEHRRTITAGTGAELVEGRPREPDRQALRGILLRAEHRHPVGVPAPGTRQFGHDLLAAWSEAALCGTCNQVPASMPGTPMPHHIGHGPTDRFG
jgi:hypothetical protein